MDSVPQNTEETESENTWRNWSSGGTGMGGSSACCGYHVRPAPAGLFNAFSQHYEYTGPGSPRHLSWINPDEKHRDGKKLVLSAFPWWLQELQWGTKPRVCGSRWTAPLLEHCSAVSSREAAESQGWSITAFLKALQLLSLYLGGSVWWKILQ